jgi:uncharacterized membrane protein YozB (DUF420 family)
MYTPLLFVHSWIRWVALVVGVIAVGRALAAVRTRRPYTPLDEGSGRRFVIALDVQFLLGVVLYVWASPFTTAAFGDFASAMRNPPLRFFVVEHVFGMVVSLALVHIGRARLRRLTESSSRHRTALVFFGIALVIMLVSIPWPGMPAGRPLFRGF